MFNQGETIQAHLQPQPEHQDQGQNPCRITEARDTGPHIGQGTISGSIISSVGLDQGFKEYFHPKEEEKNQDEEQRNEEDIVKYDNNPIYPMLFQDDVFNPSKSVETAQDAIKRVETLLESKLLDLNEDKSVFIVAGRKKARSEMQRKIDSSPLLLYGSRMKQATVDKYLGCKISVTAADSVAATVSNRLGAAYRSIYEARTVVEDSRATAAGGITLIFEIFEMSIIPMLLFGAECFDPIPKKTLDSLNRFSNSFLRLALGLPKNGGIISSLYFDTGTLLISNRILLAKMIFTHHLATLPEQSLAKDFYNTQRNNPNEYPGIVTETLKTLQQWGFNDISVFSKYSFKKVIKAKIFAKNESDLLQSMMNNKKIDVDSCRREGFGMKPYLKEMNLSDARMYYRIKYHLVPTIRLNQKNNKRYKAQKWLCPDCSISKSLSDYGNYVIMIMMMMI